MSDLSAGSLSDEDSEDWSKPARIDERTVDAATWHAWAASARSASDAGLRWGAIVALTAGLIPAGIGLLILLPSPASLGVLIYAPLLGWAGLALVSARVRRRRFMPIAEEMKDVMVPDLIRTPSVDELHKLASTRHAHFIEDSTVCRVEDRLDLCAIRIFEYPLDRVPVWGGGYAGGGGFGGGGDGGGGC
jgi:hypothetical protein